MTLRPTCSCPACRPVTSTLQVTSVPLPECPCPCGCSAPMSRALQEAQEVCTPCVPHQDHTFRAARDRVLAQQQEDQRQARLHRERQARQSRSTHGRH